MTGFKAAEVVEELTYDFNPHADVSGTITEPSSKQIEVFRKQVVASIQEVGIDPSQFNKTGVSLEDLGDLMEKSDAIEVKLKKSVSTLTGIEIAVLKALPYRVSQAFLGWIMGLFFSPEA